MTFKAHITHVNSSGFTVRLDDNGLEGFVDLRKDPEKFSYDKWTSRPDQHHTPVPAGAIGRAALPVVDAANQYRAMFRLVEAAARSRQNPEVKTCPRPGRGGELMGAAVEHRRFAHPLAMACPAAVRQDEAWTRVTNWIISATPSARR